MSEKFSENDIAISKNTAANRFEARVADELAVAEYRISEKRIIFTHTEVPPALRGRGIAKHLMKFAVKAAEEEGFEVAAECSYVAHFLRNRS